MLDQKTIDELKSLQPGAIIYYYQHLGKHALDPHRVWKGRLFLNLLNCIPPIAGFVIESLEPGHEYLREVVAIAQVIMYSKALNESMCNTEKSANSSWNVF